MYEITVIITAYNLQNYINKCFSELFEQTFQNFNILVVDDCSTDNTVKIISSWKEKYPDRIKTIFLKENLGMPAKTRNVALDSGLIDGNCIVFLDGDDSIDSQFLHKMHTALINNEAGVAICAYDRVEADTGHILCTEMTGFPKIIEMPPQDDMLAFINTSPWNKLWRKEVFENARFPEFKVGEEVALQFERYSKCERIAFINEPLIHYRVRKESVISNTSRETILRFADELKRCYYKQTGVFKDIMGIIVFLHIGVSMAVRAADNNNIRLREHLNWTRTYFDKDFGWFKNNRFFKLKSFTKHGMKGVMLWFCFWAYRINCFGVLLQGFRIMRKVFRIDIKF